MAIPATQRINVITPGGEVRNIDSDKVQVALDAGWRLETPEDVTRATEAEKYGGVAGTAAAAAAGAARGLTFGGSDWLAQQAGLAEPLAKLKEFHPYASLAGEIGSFVLPTGPAGGLVRGAEFLAGKLAARGARALGTEALAAKGIAGRIVSKGAEEAAKGGLLGAAFGAGTAVSEAALQDTELRAELLASAIQTGALFGGAAGAAIGAPMGALQKRIAPGAADVAPGVARKAAAGALARASSIVSGADEEALKTFFEMPVAKQRRYIDPTSAEKITDDATRQLTSTINEFEKLAPSIEEEALGTLKRDRVKTLMADNPLTPSQIFSKSAPVLSEIDSQLASMMSEGPAVYGRIADIKKMRELTENVFDKLSSLSDQTANLDDAAADMFIAIDQYKRRFGKIAKPGKMIREGAVSADNATTEMFRKTYIDTLKPHLEDAAIYGENAAELQRIVNDKWTQYLSRDDVFRQNFTVKVGTDQFNPVFEVNPESINSLVRNITSASKDLKYRSLREHMQRRLELLESIGENYKLEPQLVDDLKRAKSLVNDSLKTLDTVAQDVTLVNQFRDITSRGSTAAGALGIGGGFAAGGPAGALLGAGLAALTSPGQTLRRLTEVNRIWESSANRINKAIQKFMTVAPGAAKGATAAAIDITNRKKKDDYSKRLETLSQYAQDPDVLVQRLEKDLGNSNLTDEDLLQLASKLSNAAQFLYEKAPKASTANPFELQPKEFKPSDAQLSKFYRYVRAVEDPLSVVADLESGHVSSEAIEALQATSPKLYRQIVEQLSERVSATKKRLPYPKRVLLSRLLSMPVESSFSPQKTTTIQNSYAMAPAEEATPQRAGGPSSLSQDTLTRYQRAQLRA